MLRQVGIAALVALVLLAAACLYALAADPGGKDDPLVTLSFVRSLSSFKRVDIAAKRGLRLSPGVEFVLVNPADAPVNCPVFDPRKSIVVNLSDGERLLSPQLAPFKHLVNASEGDIFLKFDQPVTLLLKGEWK